MTKPTISPLAYGSVAVVLDRWAAMPLCELILRATFSHTEADNDGRTLHEFFGFPAEEDQEDIIEFAAENGMGINISRYIDLLSIVLTTYDPRVATLFKLKWGGDA